MAHIVDTKGTLLALQISFQFMLCCSIVSQLLVVLEK
jgi:hypothetical protein